MSVNYHAFQCKGVLFSTYEKVCDQWQKEYSHYDPARINRILGLEYDDTYLYLTYFQLLYRLRLKDGVLEKKTEDGWSEEVYFNEAMAIYHLLYYTKDLPTISGKRVPSYTLDGVVSRNSIADPLLTPLEKKYTGKIQKLDAVCMAAGGTKLTSGDVAHEFEAFPSVHLRLVFWDADEDFPAQAQILVDQCVTDYLHYETVGCLIADLLEKL